MYKYIYEDLELEVPTEASEIKFENYLNFLEANTNSHKYLVPSYLPILYLEKLLGLEEGDLDIPLDDIQILNEKMQFFYDDIIAIRNEVREDINFKHHLVLDGKDFCYRSVKGLNDMTAGEYASIDLIRMDWNDSIKELYPRLLAILVRPAKKVIDKVTGQEIWKQQSFNADPEILNDRIQFMKDHIDYRTAEKCIGFFLSGTKKSEEATLPYTKQKEALTHQRLI